MRSVRSASETRAACALLGVERVEFLPYRDSGMPGNPANRHPLAFARADLDSAAERLAGIVTQQHASDLVIYDAGGIYGHPDHIQAHRVGAPAARLAAVSSLYESTVDRDYLDLVSGCHLVTQAHRNVPGDLSLGVSSGLVSSTVDTVDHLDRHHRPSQPAPHDLRRGHHGFQRLRPALPARVVYPARPGWHPRARRTRSGPASTVVRGVR